MSLHEPYAHIHTVIITRVHIHECLISALMSWLLSSHIAHAWECQSTRCYTVMTLPYPFTTPVHCYHWWYPIDTCMCISLPLLLCCQDDSRHVIVQITPKQPNPIPAEDKGSAHFHWQCVHDSHEYTLT